MRHDDGFHLIDPFENDARLWPHGADCSLEAMRTQFYDTLRESTLAGQAQSLQATPPSLYDAATQHFRLRFR